MGINTLSGPIGSVYRGVRVHQPYSQAERSMRPLLRDTCAKQTLPREPSLHDGRGYEPIRKRNELADVAIKEESQCR